MIIPIFSNIIVMAFYTVLNIEIVIVSPLNPLFPFLKHYTIRFSVRELYAGRVFLMIFMIRHKSYMRVTAVILDHDIISLTEDR